MGRLPQLNGLPNGTSSAPVRRRLGAAGLVALVSVLACADHPSSGEFRERFAASYCERWATCGPSTSSPVNEQRSISVCTEALGRARHPQVDVNCAEEQARRCYDEQRSRSCQALAEVPLERALEWLNRGSCEEC